MYENVVKIRGGSVDGVTKKCAICYCYNSAYMYSYQRNSVIIDVLKMLTFNWVDLWHMYIGRIYL